jgi:hypothetical protein
MPAGSGLQLWSVRVALIVIGLAGWFWTQRLIARRRWPSAGIGDAVHGWTEPVNRYLREHPRAANTLIIVTSAVIDLLGLFLLGSAIFGPSIRPFLGLVILFALRQACQGLCALPEPRGSIWRSPGVPSLLVTYGTANDLFFSGHTAIAVYGAIELAAHGGGWGLALGVTIAVVEALAVLVLRAHYTMDVFAAVVAALWAAGAAATLGPFGDRVLLTLAGG